MDGQPRREAFLVANSKISKMYSANGNEYFVQVLAPKNNIINIAAVATHTKKLSTATRFELVQRKPLEGSSASAVVASTTAVSSSHASGYDARTNHGRRKAFDDLSKPSRKGTMGILREARVVVHRLTDQQIKDAGNKSTRPTITHISARKSLDKAKHNGMYGISDPTISARTISSLSEKDLPIRPHCLPFRPHFH